MLFRYVQIKTMRQSLAPAKQIESWKKVLNCLAPGSLKALLLQKLDTSEKEDVITRAHNILEQIALHNPEVAQTLSTEVCKFLCSSSQLSEFAPSCSAEPFLQEAVAAFKNLLPSLLLEPRKTEEYTNNEVAPSSVSFHCGDFPPPAILEQIIGTVRCCLDEMTKAVSKLADLCRIISKKKLPIQTSISDFKWQEYFRWVHMIRIVHCRLEASLARWPQVHLYKEGELTTQLSDLTEQWELLIQLLHKHDLECLLEEACGQYAIEDEDSECDVTLGTEHELEEEANMCMICLLPFYSTPDSRILYWGDCLYHSACGSFWKSLVSVVPPAGCVLQERKLRHTKAHAPIM